MQIGQGTYSSVFRAREVETGKIVALKKVRFDNFQPESIRFMAREIMILRRLDHPNIMKLEGVIASRSSTSIYLVFDYMEHDLAGLVSCPDVKFSEAQVSLYLRLCHSERKTENRKRRVVFVFALPGVFIIRYRGHVTLSFCTLLRNSFFFCIG